MQLQECDKKFLARPGAPGGIELVSSEDCFLYDSDNKKYIDFIMGWCVGNFGWGNDKIADARQKFSGPDYVYGTFLYQPWARLAQMLADITPGDKLVKSYRSVGGTQAVETGMKIAMLYTGRPGFLSVEGCYHGNSLAVLSIGKASNKKTYCNLLPGCVKIDTPLDLKAAKKVEAILKKKNIAGFVLEPINTHPRVHIPDAGFIDEIKGMCKKYGTLLIADEVAVGFGRTGKIFACEHFGLQPDILCLAKALSGGNAAIGAAVTSEKISKKVEQKISAYPTYGWHPLSVETAIASVSYLVNNKEILMRNVEEIGALLEEGLQKIKFRRKIRVVRKGLAISVDVGSESYASRLVDKCLQEGLLIEYNGPCLMLFPALTMDKLTAQDGLDILAKCT